MTPPFGPILVNIGPLPVYWYGLLIVTGIVLGANVAAYLAKQSGENSETVWDMLLVAVILGIIGARLYHVVSSPNSGLIGWDYYRQHPLEIFNTRKGGLGIYGAIIGGAMGVIAYSMIRHLRPLQWLDYGAPGMAIGQAIGRWGNFLNRELYGPPTNLPWGLRIPALYRIAPYTDMTKYPEDTLFQPTFLYESLAALFLCLLLIWIAAKYRARLKEGDLLIGYLIGYSVIRFFTEFLRPDAWMVGTMAAAQLVALIFIVTGVLALIVRRWLAAKMHRTA